MSAPTLDGKNLYQWRTEYNELATQFVRYAEHNSGCRPGYEFRHKHNTPIDNRIVCDEQPCNCGLVDKLHALMPTIEYTIPCPDKPRLTDLKVYGLPVYEDDSMPPDTIRIVSEPDRSQQEVSSMGWCVWRDASKCAERMNSAGFGYKPCKQKHHNQDMPQS